MIKPSSANISAIKLSGAYLNSSLIYNKNKATPTNNVDNNILLIMFI